MSRMNPGQPLVVKPSNNIYTALTGAALLVVIFAIVTIILKYNELGMVLFKTA